MDFSKLRTGEMIACVGGLLMLISLFVKCYETRPENPNAQINGKGGPNAAPGIESGDGTYSFFAVHELLRFLFIVGALAPFVLAWIIVRDHKLSWPRGELTAIAGIIAVGLVFYTGIVDRPGEPSGEIELEIGWYGMMLGAILIVVGGAFRSGESERRKKPPGVL